ncbi:hypothetical protein [Pseudomonas sp. GM55]|uniref:hypothetical protein n=1 Tax=Pseudomonas sp. GM55 TaxID=1144333 RepID=UPI000270B706|nr:hypothetical protein [Pseudomonas sp. GM55]EJM72174.1 hypothetical protein PMI31_03769 [Pseudomonas sp. GM55]
MTKLLNRLKIFLGQKTAPPPAPTERVVDTVPLIEVNRIPSQAEENLAWLPINSEPEVFVSLMPPACPDLRLVDTHLLQRYRLFVTENDPIRAASESMINRDEASQLARYLFEQGTDLGYCRGTDYSLEIYWLMQCAAIVSLLGCGRQSEQFLFYKKHVDYYHHFPLSREQVQMFYEYVDLYSKASVEDGGKH